MIEEGVNDPSIFKAVFLAGGPGSGKSFIVGKTALTALGMKVVNSDDAFERGLKAAGLEMTPDNIYSPKGQEIRARAKALTKSKQQGYLNGRLGMVIDGTGKDYDKIVKQAIALRKLGYDVAMIFVNTDEETALKRNRMRSRSLPDATVSKMWKDVQKNLGSFQTFFGNFFIIDNSEGSDYDKQVMDVYKKMAAWSKSIPTNRAVKSWMNAQRSNVNEKFMNDKEYIIGQALSALHRLVTSKGPRQSISGYAFNIVRSYNIGLTARELEKLYRDKYNVKEEAPATSTTSVAGAGDDGIVAIDRRYRKDKLPRVLKRFRGFMRDSDA